MARIYPILTDLQLAQLPSQAEATVYRIMRDSLDDRFLVIHGKSFVATRKDGSHGDGEADFVVLDEQYGMLVVEVKGGGVSFDPRCGWRSVDRLGNTHEIKDPLSQAKSQKHALLRELKQHRAWNSFKHNLVTGHAILLPDVEKTDRLQLPECPPEIVGGRNDINDIQTWIENAFRFWAGNNYYELGPNGLSIVEKILCHPIDVRPLLKDILAADDDIRIRLTSEQAKVLRTLGRHKRAGIVGAAGTGKTILAVEKARMLAEAGASVLLLCYNKALGATLSRQFQSHRNILARTFHAFCEFCCSKARDAGLSDPVARAKAEVPNDPYFEVQLPLAAYYALEDLGGALQFDAIVVDEGQDFGDEFWLPVEMALRSSDDSWLYVFYDENQRLYSRVSSFPIPEKETFPLTRNCRNAKPVHDLAYRYYAGEKTDDSDIKGVPPAKIAADGQPAQAQLIGRQITKLIHDEGVDPNSIAVLLAIRDKEPLYNLLKEQPLPKPAQWSREEHFMENSVLMDTVRRFKGLERDVVFLWLDDFSLEDTAVLYVGISRAKSALYLVGAQDVLSALKI